MKTIDKKCKIVDIKRYAKKLMLGKMTISSLFIFSTVGMPVVNANKVDNLNKVVSEIDDSNNEYEQSNCEGYSFYHMTYSDAINSLNDNDFDQKFQDIYLNGKYIINDIEYDIKEVYITKLDDESVHIYKAGDNRKDIITNQTFTGKNKKICCFRDSSIFYELYEANIINDTDIKLDINNINQISNWDGIKSDKTKNLMAEKIAKEEYGRKYGK